MIKFKILTFYYSLLINKIYKEKVHVVELVDLLFRTE